MLEGLALQRSVVCPRASGGILDPSGSAKSVLAEFVVSAVMAKYNPFGEKAGMKKTAEQPPPKEAVRIAQALSQLGFDVQLLGSARALYRSKHCPKCYSAL